MDDRVVGRVVRKVSLGRGSAHINENRILHHPGGNPGANLKSISHRCHLFEAAFVWELTKETIVMPLGCLQGGINENRILHPGAGIAWQPSPYAYLCGINVMWYRGGPVFEAHRLLYHSA